MAWSVGQVGTSDGVPVLTCILCVQLKILAPPVPILARGALSKKPDGLAGPCLLVGSRALFLLCLLVIDTALASAVSFSTIEVSFDWNSSPNNVFFFIENSSEPNPTPEGVNC